MHLDENPYANGLTGKDRQPRNHEATLWHIYNYLFLRKSRALERHKTVGSYHDKKYLMAKKGT